jgi:hypothetical protein
LRENAAGKRDVLTLVSQRRPIEKFVMGCGGRTLTDLRGWGNAVIGGSAV